METHVKKHPSKNWLLQWRSCKGKHWYPINEQNIVPVTRSPDAFKNFREEMSRIYRGETGVFDGCYVKSTRTLALTKRRNALKCQTLR